MVSKTEKLDETNLNALPEPDLTDPENPEWTEEDFAQARPASEVLPRELYQALTRGRGRLKSETSKIVVNLRLDADVVDWFRAAGTGWQTRMNAALRQALDSEKE